MDQQAPVVEMALVMESAGGFHDDPMLGYDLNIHTHRNDLPKFMRSCDLAEVEVRFPMLNDASVAFSAALPARLKAYHSPLAGAHRELREMAFDSPA